MKNGIHSHFVVIVYLTCVNILKYWHLNLVAIYKEIQSTLLALLLGF
jgi:hypothetical protein